MSRGRKLVGYWLCGCAGSVACVVLIGGATRLTESGLSMTTWKPQGSLPPMNDEEWEKEFSLYKESPEFRLKNANMQIDEFKSIFWWEWGHRMAARSVGMLYAIPLFGLLLTRSRALPSSLRPRCIGILGLGLAQGAMGWYMVKSGLSMEWAPEDEGRTPTVSPYRLASHLSLALATFCALSWTALDVLAPSALANAKGVAMKLKGPAAVVAALAATTIFSGALVAGNDAGLAFCEYPLMGGKLIPDHMAELQPFWRNFFEDVTLVQFDHRMLAHSTMAAAAFLLYTVRKNKVVIPSALALRAQLLVAAVLAQASLGITTLLMSVPVPLGVAHQGGSLVVLTAALRLLHGLKRARL